ncbi:solute carrier family 22 member 7-like [Aplochiton taeniatus]
MKFDNILSEINGFGKFQIVMVLIQSISRMTLPCHFLLNNFIAAVPSHHCDLSAFEDEDIFSNLTQEQRLAVSIPFKEDGTPNSCEMFVEPQYHLLYNSSNVPGLPTVHCQDGWVYDNSTFTSTVATEWDLVCNRKGMNKATATIFFIGVMCGAPLFGFLSDRFGRRSMLMVSYLSTMVFAISSAFSTSYVTFVILRFFTGLTLAGISIISIVLNVEWFDIDHRTFAGVIVSLDWTIGNWLLAGTAYFVNDWRWLIIAVTSPLLLSIIAWRWLPESARWLIVNGKPETAHTYLMRCAKMNNRSNRMTDMSPATLLNSINVESGDKKYTVLDKGLSEASFTIMFLYTTELYPTVVRQNGLGYTSFLARLGVSIAPLIILLEDVWVLLPAGIYCLVAIGSGLTASLLPETLNIRLPEYIEDIEQPRCTES